MGDIDHLTIANGGTNKKSISALWDTVKFFGRISAKKRIPAVMPQAKSRREFSPPPNDFSARPPTKVAPSVLAIVLRLRIAELVSSISKRYFFKRVPRFGAWFLKFSISAVVILRIIASRTEHNAEIPIVRAMAMTKSEVMPV
jgi:hypothetical protein